METATEIVSSEKETTVTSGVAGTAAFEVTELYGGHILYGMKSWPLIGLVDEEGGGDRLAYPAGTQAGGVPGHLEQKS